MGSDSAAFPDFESLLTTFDAMQANFEALRHPDETAELIQPLPRQVVVDEKPSPDQQSSLESQAAPASAVASTAGRKVTISLAQATALQPLRAVASGSIRVRAQLLDRMVNQAGEVMITRSRLEAELGQLRGSLNDLSGNLTRLRAQLRDVEMHSESLTVSPACRS